MENVVVVVFVVVFVFKSCYTYIRTNLVIRALGGPQVSVGLCEKTLGWGERGEELSPPDGVHKFSHHQVFPKESSDRHTSERWNAFVSSRFNYHVFYLHTLRFSVSVCVYREMLKVSPLRYQSRVIYTSIPPSFDLSLSFFLSLYCSLLLSISLSRWIFTRLIKTSPVIFIR